MVAAGPVRGAVGRVTRTVVATGAAAAIVGFPATSASAGVTGSGGSATADGSAVITFQVTNDRARARIVRIDVQLPTVAPTVSVLAGPVHGWSPSIRTRILGHHPNSGTPNSGDTAGNQHGGHAGGTTEIPADVSWQTTVGAPGIGPGEFEQFRIDAGPLPAPTSLRFTVVRTYSDGGRITRAESSVQVGITGAVGGNPAGGGPLVAGPRTSAGPSGGVPGVVLAGAYLLGGLGLLTGAAVVLFLGRPAG